MKAYADLLFDADDTLLDFHASERIALADALTRQHLPVTDEVINTYHAINHAIWRQIEAGNFDRAALNETRFARLDAHFSFGCDILRLGRDFLDALSQCGLLLAGAVEICRDLSARYRLSIITNGFPQVQHGRLDHAPLRPYLTRIFISQEIGAEKPHAAFFDAVEAGLSGFSRERALVIGDSPTADIAGGMAAGIDTCWYNAAGRELPAGIEPTYTVLDYDGLRRLLL